MGFSVFCCGHRVKHIFRGKLAPREEVSATQLLKEWFVMAKRKFDSKRTYKLVFRIVIAVALLFGLLGAAHLNSAFRGAYSEDKIKQRCRGSEAESGCSNYFIIYGHHIPTDDACLGTEAETACRVYYYLESDKVTASGLRNLGIAAALLVIFFGGTWLYRYLFPVQDTKANGKEN